jgi:hypothetical protein
MLVLATESSAHSGDVLKGWGTATIDGRMSPGEWAHAAHAETTVEFGAWHATIYMMNDRSRLYLAFALHTANPPLAASEGLEFHFDNLHAPNPGGDVLRLLSSGAAFDMYYDPTTTTIFPDEHDGGTEDIQGAVGRDSSGSFWEVSHPLDSADDAHDFSAQAGSRVGVLVTFVDCYCVGGRSTNWPLTGPWADVAIARTVPTLALHRARFHPLWRASSYTGTLELNGGTSDGGELVAALYRRNASRPFFVQRGIDVGVGSFRRQLRPPITLLPGRYAVELGGSSDGYPLGATRQTLELAAPPEGVVRRVLTRATENSPWSAGTSLPRGTHQIWMRFGFAARPRAVCTTRQSKGSIEYLCRPPISITWIEPDGRLAGPPKQKGNGPTIVTVVGATVGTSLSPGTWKCILRVGGVAVKEASVTIG